MADPTGATPSITTSTQQFVLALLVLAMAGGMLTLLFFVQIPKDNQQLLTLSLGIVLGIAGTIASFYWPSSVGARSKDETISKLADQVAGPTGPAKPVTIVADPKNPVPVHEVSDPSSPQK